MDPGGYDFAADPALAAPDAQVFWQPTSTAVITATAAPPPLALCAVGGPAWPQSQAERHTALEHHLILAGSIETQVALLGRASIGAPLTFQIPDGPDLPQRVEQLLDFWRRRAGTASREEITPLRRRRLILGLRALDGRAAGASYRTLAGGLFGPNRVPLGPAWKSHDLRSRTMRLVADATALMRGGYRGLIGLPPGAC